MRWHVQRNFRGVARDYFPAALSEPAGAADGIDDLKCVRHKQGQRARLKNQEKQGAYPNQWAGMQMKKKIASVIQENPGELQDRRERGVPLGIPVREEECHWEANGDGR